MQDQKKVYGLWVFLYDSTYGSLGHFLPTGFTLSLYEYIETIPTLWDATKEFMKLHPEYIAKDNALGFLSDDGGETYNKCHCELDN